MGNEDYADCILQAVEIIPEGIVILDKAGTILYINPPGQKIFSRYSGSSIAPGSAFLKSIPKGGKAVAAKLMQEALQGATPSSRLSYRQEEKEHWIQLSYSSITSEEPMASLILVQIKEITGEVKLMAQLENQLKRDKKELIKATLEARESERQLIGKELHDDINQVLTTAKLYNELCLAEEKTNKVLLQKSIQQIAYCISEIRKISDTFSSSKFDGKDLEELIRELAHSVNSTQRVRVRFKSFRVQDKDIDERVQTALYRIVQEQTTNILKHAEASVVDIILVGNFNRIALRIQDDGKGFDANQKRFGT